MKTFEEILDEIASQPLEGWDFSRFMDVDGPLPFRDGSMDVVIDRHEAFRTTGVARVLTAGGTFLTHRPALRAIHDHIAEHGAFETHHHRLLLEATKP